MHKQRCIKSDRPKTCAGNTRKANIYLPVARRSGTRNSVKTRKESINYRYCRYIKSVSEGCVYAKGETSKNKKKKIEYGSISTCVWLSPFLSALFRVTCKFIVSAELPGVSTKKEKVTTDLHRALTDTDEMRTCFYPRP